MAQHNELGKIGEDFAAAQLVKEGYTILERNWRSGKSELDIIAEKDGLIVVVEVKTRRNNIFADPTQSISLKKIEMLLKGAMAYVEENKIEKDIRLDVFTVIMQDAKSNQFAYEHIVDSVTACNLPFGFGL